MSNIQPKSISKAPHVAAFDSLAETRLAALDPSVVITYLIDTVSASALPYLAETFDVMGYKGYRLATTDEQRREIIKQAIELKRRMGTAWAVRQALSAVGFGSEAVIVESCGTTGNPSIDWAIFRVEIDLGDSVGISGTLEDEATALINEYKNVRSHLDSITYKAVVSDTLVIPVDDDELLIDVATGAESDTLDYFDLYYDGSWSLDGTFNYDETKSEALEVIIL